MGEYELNRIGVPSFAKIYVVLAVTMAAVFGWPVLFFEAAFPGTGIVSFILIVLFAALWGAIGGAATALIYNFAAAPLDGVVLDLDGLPER